MSKLYSCLQLKTKDLDGCSCSINATCLSELESSVIVFALAVKSFCCASAISQPLTPVSRVMATFGRISIPVDDTELASVKFNLTLALLMA
jgi:hypothetical protein